MGEDRHEADNNYRRVDQDRLEMDLANVKASVRKVQTELAPEAQYILVFFLSPALAISS